jgi:PadR family transcriptional regulator AphA
MCLAYLNGGSPVSPLIRQPLTVEHALLGFLHDKPMHGYEIYQRVVALAGLGLVWQVKQSHLYAMLDKLEGDGYIAGRQQAQDMRPPRRIFRLTSAGRNAFREWLSRPVSHGREIRLEFMTKLFFARRAGLEWVSGLVVRQQQECAEWRAKLLAQAGATAGRGSYEWLVYQFRVGQVEAMMAWLALCAEAGPSGSQEAG